MAKITHKDVKLAPGDKVNVYDKSRDKNHAFHVYTEPDGNNTWHSVQDKDGEAIFDTGNQLTGDDLADFMNGKVVEIGLVDPDDPLIKDLAERSDVTDLAEQDLAASAAGAHEYQFTDRTGLKHDLWSDDGKSQYEHAVSDPNIKDHYQLTNIERDGKEIYNAKEAEAERERDEQALLHMDEPEQDDPSDDLPF